MSEKVKLTAKEKSELWIEGIVTVILLLMLNFALLVLINQMIAHNPGLENAIWGVKNEFDFWPRRFSPLELVESVSYNDGDC